MNTPTLSSLTMYITLEGRTHVVSGVNLQTSHIRGIKKTCLAHKSINKAEAQFQAMPGTSGTVSDRGLAESLFHSLCHLDKVSKTSREISLLLSLSLLTIAN